MSQTSCELPTSRPKHLWAIWLIVGILVVFLVQTFGSAYRDGGNDFTSYLLSAEALSNGDSPYQTASALCYIYPLFFAFILIPLTVIPYWLATFLWFGLSVASLAAGCFVLLQIAADEVKTNLGWHLAIPALVVFIIMLTPIQSNLLNGQVNLIVLFCCIMFFRSFTRNEGILAAAWLAAGIAIKLLPAGLLLFLLVRRQYRILLATVGFVALFCLLPGVILGKNILTLYKEYIHAFLMPSLMNPGACNKGLFFNLQGTIEYFTPIAKSNPWTGAASLLAAVAAILAIDVANLRSRRDVWPFCAYLLGFLLISPAAETHHLVFAIPTVLLVGLKLLFDGQWAIPAVVALALLFVACFDIGANLYKTTPFYFVSLVALLALLFLASRKPKAAVCIEA